MEGWLLLAHALQALLARPSLGLVAAALLATATLFLLAELVRDALRARRLAASGEQAAWLAKAEAVAAAAALKAAAAGEKVKAKDWAERNVAGAASEEDASLIRGMNEFLQ